MTSVRTPGPRSRHAPRESSRGAARARRSGAVTATDRPSVAKNLRLAEGVLRRGVLRRSGLEFVVGASLIVLVLFALAAVTTIQIEQQAHIDRTNAQIAAAETRAEELRVELAELQSPEYVTTRAATVLGMIPAPTPVYLQPRGNDDARAAEVPVVTSSRSTTARSGPTTATTVKR